MGGTQESPITYKYGARLGSFTPSDSVVSKYHGAGLQLGVFINAWQDYIGALIEYNTYTHNHSENIFGIDLASKLEIQSFWLSPLLRTSSSDKYIYGGIGPGLVFVNSFGKANNIEVSGQDSFVGLQILLGVNIYHFGLLFKHSYATSNPCFGKVGYGGTSILGTYIF